MLAGAGFQVQKVYSLNKIGTPPWWIYSKLLGSVHINKVTLKIFDKTVWLWSGPQPHELAKNAPGMAHHPRGSRLA